MPCRGATRSSGKWWGRSLPFFLQTCSLPPASSRQSPTGSLLHSKNVVSNGRITEQRVEGWVWSREKTASCLHRYKLGHSTYQCNFPFPPTPLLGLSCHLLAPFPSGILLGVCGAEEVPRSVSAIVRMPLVCRFQRYPYLQVSDRGSDDLGGWSHLALFTNSSSSSGLF